MINGHAYWSSYLAKGKHKAKTTDRPIGKKTTRRVVRLENGDVGLKLHNTYCVIFHADDTVTINTGGWDTVTTKAFINEYAPVRLFSEKGNLFLWIPNPEFTKPRVGKCRICHGRKTRPHMCHGPGYCYSFSRTCEHGHTNSYHRLERCSHGESQPHALSDVECYRCQGTGSVDYGSKPVHFGWTGKAYRFDPDDITLGVYHVPDTVAAPSPSVKPYSYGHAYVTPPVNDYSDSGNILTGAMPDIMSTVMCPCGCGCRESVRMTIIHLNDTKQWTRERVADWLDTLDLDLRFPAPDTT